MTTATTTHQSTQNQLNEPQQQTYHSSRNTQMPPQMIHVQIPLECAEVGFAVEVVVNGHRLNGYISEKDVWDAPVRNPANDTVGLAKIVIIYTDRLGEDKFFQAVSIKDEKWDHFICKYHWHFIPNSAHDMNLKRIVNSRQLNRLSFNPHTSTVLVDHGINRQWEMLLGRLKTLTDDIMEHQSLFVMLDMKSVFDEFVKISTQKMQQTANHSEIRSAMATVNRIENKIFAAKTQQNNVPHTFFGNVHVVETGVTGDGSVIQSNTAQTAVAKNSTPSKNATAKTTPPKNLASAAVVPTVACPFPDCGSIYSGKNARTTYIKHLPTHSNDSDYETILPYGCGKDGCVSRFESKKDLRSHQKYSPAHAERRIPLEPHQKCPKCVYTSGVQTAGTLCKGLMLQNKYTMVFCSRKKKCGFSQSLKAVDHGYTYTPMRKKSNK